MADALGGLLLSWVCPCPDGGPQAALSNLFFYPAVLVGIFWIFVPPLIPVLGILYCWRHRRETAVRFTLWVTALSLILFTFYFYQGARFMAAPVTLLSVFAAAQLAGWVRPWARIHLHLRTAFSAFAADIQKSGRKIMSPAASGFSSLEKQLGP